MSGDDKNIFDFLLQWWPLVMFGGAAFAAFLKGTFDSGQHAKRLTKLENGHEVIKSELQDIKISAGAADAHRHQMGKLLTEQREDTKQILKTVSTMAGRHENGGSQ